MAKYDAVTGLGTPVFDLLAAAMTSGSADAKYPWLHFQKAAARDGKDGKDGKSSSQPMQIVSFALAVMAFILATVLFVRDLVRSRRSAQQPSLLAANDSQITQHPFRQLV